MKRNRNEDEKTLEQRAHEAIRNFCIYSGLDFNVVRTPYWQSMINAIALCKEGFKGPSAEALRGRMLTDAVQHENKTLAELRDSWVETGCTIMSHGWTDSENLAILDILVSSPTGTIFIKSVEASDQVKSGSLLFELFESIVLEVGVKHVVQFVSDNASLKFAAAGRLLMEKYPTLFWTPCVAHCLDLMLWNIGILTWVKVILDKAMSITRYIYNHAWVLNLMRKHADTKELALLVHPFITRSVSDFILLQSLCALEMNLKRLLLSEEWLDSSYSKTTDGKGVATLVFSDPFWRDVGEVIAISEPLVKVVRMVDVDKFQMGSIYEAMDTAKESIRAKFQDNGDTYKIFFEIINCRWRLEFYGPLHAAGYYLNPAFFYDKSLNSNPTVTEGLFQCIERMFPNHSTQSSIIQQLQHYQDAWGLFGSDVAVQARKTVLPSVWWQKFGSKTPDLQKFAIRILSQTCSVSRCEHNCTMVQNIHSKKHNKLAQKWMNDLLFVQYNLRLHNKELEGTSSAKAIELHEVDPTSEWIVDTGESSFGDEDISWTDSETDIDAKSDSKSLTTLQSVAGKLHQILPSSLEYLDGGLYQLPGFLWI